LRSFGGSTARSFGSTTTPNRSARPAGTESLHCRP
jgi:hypothetical protein